ncbi:chain length-determining protein [Geothermobacter hydrogeniphilus]|uniref:Chain length-determining protein n=1 Tax=Geothermobacter hydrogeniphilus TaxID=1969733 RepID=A0A2K2H9F5_9BACT|nr:XrtA system polysaccharide chain length determinant [Geothermobacter hydrogeniphilus]PNU19958.1 chain length-determining protein [Geothermobacter hydrogeniphilus]
MKELFRYLEMIYERRTLFVLTTILATVVFICGSYLLPRKYEADSTVFIEKSVINNLVKGLAITPDMDDRIRVLKYALLSRGLITRVLKDLDMDTLHPDVEDFQELVSNLQGRTKIEVKGKDLFTVSLVDRNPKFAQQYVNRLVSAYVEENLSGKREETYGANRFLQDQLTHFKKKLDTAEDAIIAFRKKQGIFLSQDEAGSLADLKDYQKQIEQIGIQLNTLKARKTKLGGQMRSLEPTIAVFSEKQRDDRISFLEARLQQLLLTYTENYPDVVRLKAEMEDLKARNANGVASKPVKSEMMVSNPVYQDVQQKMLAIEAEIGALTSHRKSLRKIIADRKAALQNVPVSRKKLAVLTQERDSYRKIYQELLLRLGQAEVSKQMEIGDKATTFRIVDPAYLPTRPIFPNRIKMIFLAVCAAIGVGAGLVILLESLKGAVRSADELTLAGLSIIGVIPVIVDSESQAALVRGNRMLGMVVVLYSAGIATVLACEMFLPRG